MSNRLIPFAAALALAGAAFAQERASPSDAAKAFTLDGLPATPTPKPTLDPSASPSPTADASPRLAVPVVPDATPTAASPVPDGTATPTAVRAVFTLDTPIQDLIANAGAKAVLDKDLPGVSNDENLDKFKALSLRAFQPMTGGQMTDAMLAKVAADLDRLAGGNGVVTAPVRVGNPKRGRDDSR